MIHDIAQDSETEEFFARLPDRAFASIAPVAQPIGWLGLFRLDANTRARTLAPEDLEDGVYLVQREGQTTWAWTGTDSEVYEAYEHLSGFNALVTIG